MLINFFKNIFPYKINPEFQDNDPAFFLYKKIYNLEYKNSKRKIIIEDDFVSGKSREQIMYDCLEKAISYNDLPVIKILYPYMVRNIRELKKDFLDNKLFKYANIAMKHNRLDIFDFFITIYKDKHPSSPYSSHSSPPEFSVLLSSAIQNNKNHYISLLKEHSLFNAHDFLTSAVQSKDKNLNNTEVVKYILSNFPIEKHKDVSFSNIANTIDVDKALNYAFRSDKLNKDVIELLINHGGDIHMRKAEFLYTACINHNFDVINLLIDNGINNNPFFSQVAIDASYADCDEEVKHLIRHGAVIDHERVVKNTIYPWLKKWNEANGLANELTSEMNISDEPIKKNKKVNKV